MAQRKLHKFIESKSFVAQYYTYTDLKDLIVWLNEMKKKGINKLRWGARTDSEGDLDVVEIHCFKEYLESIKDMKARHQEEKRQGDLREEQRKEHKEEFDRKEYERLKAKFE